MNTYKKREHVLAHLCLHAMNMYMYIYMFTNEYKVLEHVHFSIVAVAVIGEVPVQEDRV